jgi:hypothetical protein
MAGVRRVRVYDGSLLDWASDSDLPLDVETGSCNGGQRSEATTQSAGTLRGDDNNEFRRAPK